MRKPACFSSGLLRPEVLVKGWAWEWGRGSRLGPQAHPSPAVGPGTSVFSGGERRCYLPAVLNSEEITRVWNPCGPDLALSRCLSHPGGSCSLVSVPALAAQTHTLSPDHTEQVPSSQKLFKKSHSCCLTAYNPEIMREFYVSQFYRRANRGSEGPKCPTYSHQVTAGDVQTQAPGSQH